MDENLYKWLHKITSALVVATIVFMASNWYNLGRTVAQFEWELKQVHETLEEFEVFHNIGGRFTWADGQELKQWIRENTRDIRVCKERMGVVEDRLQIHRRALNGDKR